MFYGALKQSNLLFLCSRSKSTRRKRCLGRWACRWIASSTSPTWLWTSGSCWSDPAPTARSSWKPLSGWGSAWTTCNYETFKSKRKEKKKRLKSFKFHLPQSQNRCFQWKNLRPRRFSTRLLNPTWPHRPTKGASFLNPLPPWPHPHPHYPPPTLSPPLTSQVLRHRTAWMDSTRRPTGAPCWPSTPTPQPLQHQTCAGSTPTACCRRTPSPRPASMSQKAPCTQSESVDLQVSCIRKENKSESNVESWC